MSRITTRIVRTWGALALQLQSGALFTLLAIVSFAAPSAIAAEGERVFDPQLSLIGGCKEETLDPVEDPGCPTTLPFNAHPPSLFAHPKAVATDFHGNIYISSLGKKEDGSEGRIDIFDPHGVFIAELKTTGPRSLAIDSEGYLYVVVEVESKWSILRFAPCAPYEPEAGNVEYCGAPVALAGIPEGGIVYMGLAINKDDDHLFVNVGSIGVIEFASAEEGNGKIRTTRAVESWPGAAGVAVDAGRDRLYASSGFNEERVDIFDLTSVVGTPPNDRYEKIGSIEESAVPAGSFGTQLSVAVDEATSHVFVLDGENCHLYEFDENEEYLTTIDFPFQCVFGGEIGVDNGPSSPNGVLSTHGRYLYVPSHKSGTGHSFAFEESHVDPPSVESLAAANVTESEVELQAVVNPHNLATTYRFEYITEQAFDENEEEAKKNFAGASLAGDGTLAGNLDAKVSAVAASLKPGTSYRFRVLAENEEGDDEAQASFATYPRFPLEPAAACSNTLLRTGASALLPDCRAYELVTPPDTNARAPLGTSGPFNIFTNRQVSPAGDKLPFKVEGGSLPGLGGVGSFFGDPYLASRSAGGWTTAYTGPSAAEATALVAGTTSPDQGYSFWRAEGSGSAVLGGDTNYVRYPDGHSELVGQGSLGIDPKTVGNLISEGGGHIIFSTGSLASAATAVQLEPEAAPDETQAVYDRVPKPATGERETKVISLKPGDVPFGADEHAVYQGASLDGEGVAFEVNDTLYLRYDNEETFEIGENVDFAGIAEGGSRIFYMQGGDLKAFDAKAEASGVIQFSETADAVPVQVASGGTAAYFVSETAIAGSGPNPHGDEPQVNEQNLYLSEEGQISFVGVVTDRDVEGRFGGVFVDGLGLWVDAIGPPGPGRLAIVPARTNPGGSILLFKARAVLGDYDPEGHAEIYRYDSVANVLQCLSCNPTGAAASSDADLQSETREDRALFTFQAWLENLRADGRRAFFESSEPLVARDSDGLQDVYEWEDQGVGSCTTSGGCLYLISSPQSVRNEYLWAVSPTGEDVFVLSPDLLVRADADETPSIYDARVGGGFPEPVPSNCTGEACRPGIALSPLLPPVQTLADGGGGNFKPKPCPKGKHKVKRHGKVRCVKKHRHRKAAGKRRGGRR